MRDTLITKSDITSSNEEDEKGKKARAAFIEKTNVYPLAIFPKALLENLKDTKNAFKLENIEQINDTSGKVTCNKEFIDLINKRKKNSLSQRIKDDGEWSIHNWWLLVIGSAFFFAAILWMQPHANQYQAENTQLQIAKKFAQAGSWGDWHSQIEGPLDINLNEWKSINQNNDLRTSLIATRDSLIKAASHSSDSIKNDAKNTISILNKKKGIIEDSVNASIAIISDAIMNNAVKNKKDTVFYRNEYDRASIVWNTKDSIAKSLTIDLVSRIDSLGAIVNQPAIITDMEAKNKIAAINASIPNEMKYKYDLLNPQTETSSEWVKWMWGFIVVGSIFTLIFLILVIRLFWKLPKKEVEEAHNYAETLRAMAFSGRKNPSSNHKESTCKVTFHSLNEESKRLIRSVGIRYPWNMLIEANGFEFNEPLLLSEKLIDTQMSVATSPMLYVIEDDMVVVYAGIGEKKQITDSKSLLLPITEELVSLQNKHL